MEYILIKLTRGDEKHQFKTNEEFFDFLSSLKNYPVFYDVVGNNHPNKIIDYIKSIKSECNLLLEFDGIIYFMGEVLKDGDNNPLKTTLYGADAIQFTLKDTHYLKLGFNLVEDYFEDKIIDFNQTAFFKCNDPNEVEKLIDKNK